MAKKKRPKKKKPLKRELSIIRIDPPEDTDASLLERIDAHFQRQMARDSGDPRPDLVGPKLSPERSREAKARAELVCKRIPETKHYMDGGTGVVAHIFAKIGDEADIVGAAYSSDMNDIVAALEEIMKIPGISHAWFNLD